MERRTQPQRAARLDSVQSLSLSTFLSALRLQSQARAQFESTSSHPSIRTSTFRHPQGPAVQLHLVFVIADPFAPHAVLIFLTRASPPARPRPDRCPPTTSSSSQVPLAPPIAKWAVAATAVPTRDAAARSHKHQRALSSSRSASSLLSDDMPPNIDSDCAIHDPESLSTSPIVRPQRGVAASPGPPPGPLLQAVLVSPSPWSPISQIKMARAARALTSEAHQTSISMLLRFFCLSISHHA
ncbi:hypothetical protein V8E36_009535 [Tilletia maclaganii]